MGDKLFLWKKRIGDVHIAGDKQTLCGRPMLGNNYAVQGESEPSCVECLEKQIENIVNEPTDPRPLHVIAREIRADWKNVYFGAVPYLDAMQALSSIEDSWGSDDGKSIVNYFLANAQTWRGETARRIKKELKEMLEQAKS